MIAMDSLFVSWQKWIEYNVGRELAPAVLDCFLFAAGASPRPTINNKHLQINEKMVEWYDVNFK